MRTWFYPGHLFSSHESILRTWVKLDKYLRSRNGSSKKRFHKWNDYRFFYLLLIKEEKEIWVNQLIIFNKSWLLALRLSEHLWLFSLSMLTADWPFFTTRSNRLRILITVLLFVLPVSTPLNYVMDCTFIPRGCILKLLSKESYSEVGRWLSWSSFNLKRTRLGTVFIIESTLVLMK